MKVDRKLVTNITMIVLAIAVVVGVQAMRGAGTAQAAPAPKQYICHAAGPDPTQYICIHVSENAGSLNDNAGHLNEDTTTPPDHAADIPVDSCDECPGGPPPSPSPSPSPSPA